MSKDYQNINDFYKDAENHSGIWADDTNIGKRLTALKEILEVSEKIKIDWERAIFQFTIIEGEIKPSYSATLKNGELYSYPNYQIFENGGYDYLITRSKEVNNPYLIIKYNHILWCSRVKKQEYAKKAIDTYYNTFNDILGSAEVDTHRKLDYLKNGLILSFQVKYKTDSYKELIREVIFDKGVFENAWKIHLIEFLLNKKFFKSFNFENVIELIETINDSLVNNEDSLFQIHSNLEVAIRIANKNKRKASYLLKELGLCCEKLAEQKSDNKNNIVSMIYLSEALMHYETIKDAELAEKVSVKINELKKEIQLSLIEGPVENLDEIIKPLRQSVSKLLEKKSDFIYCFLSEDNPIMFPNIEMLKQQSKDRPQRIFELFKHTNFDLNGNISEQENNEEIKQKKYFRDIYSLHLKIVTACFTYNLFIEGLKKDIITYNSLIEYLNKNTWLGLNLTENRVGQKLEFNWVSIIAPALLEFFNQMKLFTNTGNANFILVIDSLTLKIEGLLRDFARVLKIKTITTNRKSKNINTKEMYIEDFLSNPKMQEYFDENDRVFFDYLFLNNGINLRNNIAHAYYKPQDYSFEKALILTVAILRLSKYTIQ